MKKAYCVYVHTNKVNGKRYVGITSQKPERRWKQGIGYRSNPYFFNSIQKYGWNGFNHEILMFGLTKDTACRWEQAFIAQWNTSDKRYGYNVGLGGEGVLSVSKTTRKRQSISAKRRFESPDEIRKNRERGLKQFSTVEAVERDRQIQLQFHKNNPEARYCHAKAVNQYDLDGCYMRSWKSARDAAKYYGISETMITGCCRKQYGRKSAGGYMWRLLSEVETGKNISPLKRDDVGRAISQYTIDGTFVKRWDKICEAEKSLKIKNVSEVCHGKRRQSGGYVWRFV